MCVYVLCECAMCKGERKRDGGGLCATAVLTIDGCCCFCWALAFEEDGDDQRMPTMPNGRRRTEKDERE